MVLLAHELEYNCPGVVRHSVTKTAIPKVWTNL